MEQGTPEPVKAAPSKPAGDPLVPLSVRVAESKRLRLRLAGLSQKRTVQQCVDEALDEWFARHE